MVLTIAIIMLVMIFRYLVLFAILYNFFCDRFASLLLPLFVHYWSLSGQKKIVFQGHPYFSPNNGENMLIRTNQFEPSIHIMRELCYFLMMITILVLTTVLNLFSEYLQFIRILIKLLFSWPMRDRDTSALSEMFQYSTLVEKPLDQCDLASHWRAF